MSCPENKWSQSWAAVSLLICYGIQLINNSSQKKTSAKVLFQQTVKNAEIVDFWLTGQFMWLDYLRLSKSDYKDTICKLL